jgi:hypothetical protein
MGNHFRNPFFSPKSRATWLFQSLPLIRILAIADEKLGFFATGAGAG